MTRTFISNLQELHEYLLKTRNDIQLDVYYKDNEKVEIEQICIQGGPNAQIIYITCVHEYEHLNEYNVEVNYDYSGQYEFKTQPWKQVLLLLSYEQLIK